MKNVLCAWELGGEQGHLATLAILNQALSQLGAAPILALKDLSQAHRFFDLQRTRLLQAPVWQLRYQRKYPVHSLADALLLKGYRQADTLESQVMAWRQMLEFTGAELVFSNYAPTIHIAARSLGLPIVTVGSGFSVEPPGRSGRSWQHFGAVSEQSLSQHEQLCLSSVNTVLEKLKLCPISYLSDLNQTDAHLFHHHRELDIYAELREQGAVYRPFPLMGVNHTSMATKGAGIFAYLKPQYSHLDLILDALSRLSVPVVVSCPGLSRDRVDQWQSRDLTVFNHLLDLAQILPGCRLLINHGGIGTIANALTFGVPSLNLPFHMENLSTSMAVKRAGIGDYLTLPAEQQSLDQQILAVAENPTIHANCQRIRGQYQTTMAQPLHEVIATIINNLTG